MLCLRIKTVLYLLHQRRLMKSILTATCSNKETLEPDNQARERRSRRRTDLASRA
jgi:hypothetical protein